MSTEDTRENGREVAPASPELRNEPEARDPNVITEADRAANPFGAARREREMHRDEGGRFAPRPEDQQDGKQPQVKPKDEAEGKKPEGDAPPERQQQPGQVPHQALAAERGKRQAAVDENAGLRQQIERQNRELAELRGMVMGRQQPPAAPQQPVPPPEFWQDPNAAMDHRLRAAMSPLQEQAQQQRLGMSQMFAVQVHGQEAVQGAIQALGELRHTNPAEYQRLEALAERSFDPVGDVVRWHKQTTAMQRYGTDPDAYINAEIERRMREMQGGGEHPSPAQQRQPVQPGPLPTSFAAQRGGGPRGGPAYGGPRALSDIMGGR